MSSLDVQTVSDTPTPPFDLDRQALENSRNKLEETAISLQPFCGDPSILQQRPCTSVAEARGYRCRCTLQIVHHTASSNNSSPDKNQKQRLQYAIRKDGKPIALEHDTYDIVNKSLRDLMRTLMHELNSDRYPLVAQYLASVSFSSSWEPLRSRLVTFHYSAEPNNHNQWIEQAEQVRQVVGATILTGRAKKLCLRTPSVVDSEVGTEDELLLQSNLGWKVTSVSSSLSNARPPESRVVRLFKPGDAFCHPNPDVCYRALSWILSRVALSNNRTRHGCQDQARLLELYCGCGAHTIPIAASGLVSQVVAVEVDDRLVQACQRNIAANKLETVVTVVSDDAGLFSNQCQRSFDILLVDPPRQGLDKRVLDLAIEKTGIYDVIYISCGREALVRDLNVLTKTEFEVVNCTLLDLFPGTESVESLVHLHRRISNDGDHQP